MSIASAWFPCCCPVTGYSGRVAQGSSLPPPESGSGSSSPLGEPCAQCAPGTTPRKYQVEISGVAGGFFCFTGCDLYNGTFILDQCWYRSLTHPEECATGGAEPLDACGFALGFDPAPCTCDNGMMCSEHRDWIRLTLDSDITVIVQGDANQRLRFQQARAEGASCAYDQHDVPRVAAGTLCNASAATCRVTAIS